MPADEEEAAIYRRGQESGEIRERLASHDRHFASINGALVDTVAQLRGLTAAVQHLSSQAESGTETSRQVALAVDRAARRQWSVWQKIFTAMAAIVAVVGGVVGMYYAIRSGGSR